MRTEEFKAKQKEEALKRMEMLGLMENPIREFKEEGIVNLSEGPGLLYWLNDEEQEMVRQFEKERESLVYHVIKTHTTIGLMYSLLNVCKYEVDWEYERERIEDSCPLAYVINVDIPDFSEYGGIEVKKINGGLKRIG